MALPDKHPEYINRVGEWIQMQDTFDGERAVKQKRLDYLPATEGMVQDGMQTPSSPGWRDYEAYLLRAVFRNFVRDAVKAMVGIIHNKPAIVTVPPRLDGILKRATIQGETMQQLVRRILVAQLLKGRIGLLVDAPTGQDVDKVLPYIAVYDAERIINWDAGHLNEGVNVLQLVVLDESGYRREGFTWKEERKYRVLTKGIPESLESGWETPLPDDDYSLCIKVNDSSMPTSADFLTPQIGGVTLKDIPFIFVGANDCVPEPEVPPLLDLSNLALAIYRAEADYRQTLYLQGQQTLVLIGVEADDTEGEAPLRIGNKGVIQMRQGSDAKYIGVSSTGLSEMRQSLENDKNDADAQGVAFLMGDQSPAASGEAGRVRIAARTTTLSSVAQTCETALERALQICAEWVGEDPTSVKVEIPKDFADQTVQGAMLLAIMQAKQLGLPLSLQSLHRLMRANDMTELTFDEENDQIEAESETMLGTMVGPYGMPTDDNFLDDNNPPDLDPAAGGNTPGQPPAPPPGATPPNQNVPVTPHVRGSPTPLKAKGAHKGASAGKKH
jgi:hypothetical protein